MRKVILYLLAFILLDACTFQSNQYMFIKDILSRESVNNDIPLKNWTASWINQDIDLYAVNAGEQIIFVDDELKIFFNGRYIYRAEGLFPNNSIMKINFDNLSVKYVLNDNEISKDRCQERIIELDEDSSKSYTQICYIEGTNDSYKNEIIINSSNLITRLRYIIHPSYPSLELSQK